MLSGLYTVTFGTPGGNVGGGVVMFVNDRILGGDLTYYYEGRIDNSSEGQFEAEVVARKYQETGESIFGNLPEIRLRLTGTEPGLVFRGHIVGQPTMSITVQCDKRAEL